MILKE